MAEYIAKERVIEEIEGMDECGCITISVNQVCDDIRSIPTADVVERSKIEDAVIIPEGATNGEMVEKILGKDVYCALIRMMYSSCCEKLDKWWNAPYKGNLSEKPTGSENEDK